MKGHVFSTTANHSETVHLDEITCGNSNFNQEERHGFTLVSLQLDDFTILWVVHYCTVAVKFLFANFDKFLEVKLRVDALNRGQGLPPVSLLDPDVDQSTLNSRSIIVICVSKRIISFQVSKISRHKQISM